MAHLKKRVGIPHCFRIYFSVIAFLECVNVVYFYRHSVIKAVSVSFDLPALYSSTRALRRRETQHHADRDAHFLIHQKNVSGLETLPHYLGYRPTRESKNDVSIVTQCSVNKFHRLLDIASRWNGYISVAVYIEGPHHGAAQAKLNALYAQHAALLDDKASFHLVINRGGKEVLEHYPHNILRNVAMDHASTDFAFVLDVDFIPSADSHAQLLTQVRLLHLEEQKQALIVPAFERLQQEGEPDDSSNITAADLPPDKDTLMSEMEDNPELYSPFHEYYYPGHGPTNFEKWYNTTQAYTIPYEIHFEPYVVVHRHPDLPRFWEHFTGYGRNKLSWVEEMAVAGYSFFVVPDSFLIHIYHDYEADRHARPFVLNEYARRFQPYLNRTYGHTLWEKEELEEWTSWRLEQFNDLQ